MKVGITFSAFDLFHAGHIKMLEEAKSKCDYLIVGLQLDPSIDRPKKNKPTQSIVERYVQVRSCKYIDEIVGESSAFLIFETKIEEIYINGVDYIIWNEEQKLTELRVLIRPLKALTLVAETMSKHL